MEVINYVEVFIEYFLKVGQCLVNKRQTISVLVLVNIYFII